MGQLVQIMVHGVGGASASEFLRVPHVQLAAGDETSGFWVPAGADGEPAVDGPVRREALAWGGSTAGSWRSALWVLLIPFALANVAGWASARTGEDHGPRPAWIVRVFALTLTLSVVLLTAVAAFDVLAIQCGGTPTCVSETQWLAPLGWSWVEGQPARALVLAALVPGLFLLMLWFAGIANAKHLEAYRARRTRPVARDDLTLSHPDFWYGRSPAARARLLHLAAARSLLAGVLAYALMAVTDGWAEVAAGVVGAVAAVAIVASAVRVAAPRTYRRAGAADPDLRALRWASWGLLVAAAVVGILGSDPAVEVGLGAPETLLAGLFVPPYVVILGLATIQAIALVAMLWLARAGGEDVAFRGRTAFYTSTLALFLVVAVGAGLHYLVAQAVGTPVAVWAGDVAGPDGIGMPWWYETTALVLLGLVVFALVRGGVTFAQLRAEPTEDQLAEARAYVRLDPTSGNDPLDHEHVRLAEIARDFRLAELVGGADRIVRQAVIVGIVLAVALLAIQSPEGAFEASWYRDAPVLGSGFHVGPLATFAWWVVAGLPLAGIALLRWSWRGGRAARRQVGRIWDVLTFWPRHVHPFAPPPYGERVVPQLRLHLDRLLAAGHAVVVAGHSQGSVISLAAVISEPENFAEPDEDEVAALHEAAKAEFEQPSRLGLVTYGSPLRVLYARLFPAYFDAAGFPGIGARVRSWHSMYCRTDVLGVPLFAADGVADPSAPCPLCGFPDGQASADAPRVGDYLIVDPERWRAVTEEPPDPVPLGHSAYHTHDAFRRHVDAVGQALAGQVIVVPPEPSSEVAGPRTE